MRISHTITTIDKKDDTDFVFVKEDTPTRSTIVCHIYIGSIVYLFRDGVLIDVERKEDIPEIINLDKAKERYKSIIDNFNQGFFERHYCTYFEDGGYESNNKTHIYRAVPVSLGSHRIDLIPLIN